MRSLLRDWEESGYQRDESCSDKRGSVYTKLMVNRASKTLCICELSNSTRHPYLVYSLYPWQKTPPRPFLDPHLLKLSPWEGVQHTNLGGMPRVQQSLCTQMFTVFILGWQHLGVNHFILLSYLHFLACPIANQRESDSEIKIVSHIFI